MCDCIQGKRKLTHHLGLAAQVHWWTAYQSCPDHNHLWSEAEMEGLFASFPATKKYNGRGRKVIDIQ